MEDCTERENVRLVRVGQSRMRYAVAVGFIEAEGLVEGDGGRVGHDDLKVGAGGTLGGSLGEHAADEAGAVALAAVGGVGDDVEETGQIAVRNRESARYQVVVVEQTDKGEPSRDALEDAAVPRQDGVGEVVHARVRFDALLDIELPHHGIELQIR